MIIVFDIGVFGIGVFDIGVFDIGVFNIGVFDKGVQQSSVKETQILSGVMPMPAMAGRAYHGRITLSLARCGWHVPTTAG